MTGTELDASVICLGTFAFGISLDEAQSFRLLDRFVLEGGNFIDTANIYGKWLEGGTSRSEIIIGKWMKQRQNRERLVIGTKGGHPDMQTMHVSRLSPAEIEADVDESLRNLQTDYIDLYWLHRDDRQRPVEEIIDTLNQLTKKGKIRYFGCSNWSIERMEAARQYADRRQLHRFVANQNMWSLAAVNPGQFTYPGLEAMDEDGLKYHERTGLPAVPYSSQANGYFSKVLRDDFALHPSYDKLKRLYDNETTAVRVEIVRKLTETYEWDATQIALAYLLAQPFPVFPIIGPQNEKQLTESLGALALKLSARTVEQLRSASHAE